MRCRAGTRSGRSRLAPLHAGRSQGRRRGRESARRCAPCSQGAIADRIAMRSCSNAGWRCILPAAAPRWPRASRRRARLSTAAAPRDWLGRLEQFSRDAAGSHERFPRGNGALERRARRPGGKAASRWQRSSAARARRRRPRRCAFRRRGSTSSPRSSCAPRRRGRCRIRRAGLAGSHRGIRPGRRRRRLRAHRALALRRSLEHLREAATALAPLGVPAMRKDFLVDPYQVLEARAAGAGGVLLIVRMLRRERTR